MARKPGFRLDRRGISTLLRGDLGVAAQDAARRVADEVRSAYPDLDEVDVQVYTTDRGAATVLVKDSKARELQAREGLLTKAAAKVGLEVKSR